MKSKSMTIYRLLIVFLICLCAVGTYLSSTAYGQCVDCYKNASQLNGHGRHSDSDPRRVINVKIDSSWGQQTNPNIWNATHGDYGPGALNMWNAVGSPYYFDLRQDASDRDTDFLIVRDSTWNIEKQGCAQTSTPVAGSGRTQRVIHLPPSAANWSQADLACILAHEIGHGLGLAGTFPPCQSVMVEPPVQSERDCRCPGSISQEDVARTNQFASNPENCRKVGKTGNNFGGGGGYVDPNPMPIFYPRTCYAFYDAIDLYYWWDGWHYYGTLYILTDYFCTY